MSLSHAQTFSSTTTKQILETLSYSVNAIYKKARTGDFAELEKDIHQQFAEAERQCMTKLLEQYDWDYPVFMSGDKTYRKTSRNKKTYMTLAGEVTLERTLYRTARNGITFCPLELNTGLVEGFWTPQEAKQALSFTLNFCFSGFYHSISRFLLFYRTTFIADYFLRNSYFFEGLFFLGVPILVSFSQLPSWECLSRLVFLRVPACPSFIASRSTPVYTESFTE